MKSILNTLRNKSVCPVPPVWIMRQAGRYLPEYREVRAQAGSFLDLAYNPDLAAEVTLQPVRRYGMDGAILFSDILIVPHALGQGLEFRAGEGPVLDTNDLKDLSLENVNDKFSQICKTVFKVRQALDNQHPQTTMIGFSGSPWTVACYMIQGHGKSSFPAIFEMMDRDPDFLDHVIDLIVDASIVYLKGQAEAGAEVLKLFDSWAGLIEDKSQFEKYVIIPTQRIIEGVKQTYPDIPFMGFPRHVPLEWIEAYVIQTGIDGLAVGEDIKMSDIKSDIVLQGNLDNQLLLEGSQALEKSVKDILNEMEGRPFIFNLGHGVIKETDPAHVQQMLDVIRQNS